MMFSVIVVTSNAVIADRIPVHLGPFVPEDSLSTYRVVDYSINTEL